MNKKEEKLFDEIQCLVEELPWTNELNLDYFETCVHEAGHGVAKLMICEKLNNPEGLSKLTLEAYVGKTSYQTGRSFKGQTRPRHKREIRHYFMFSTIPMILMRLTAQSGAILSDEFFNYFYNWSKVTDFRKLQTTYGAEHDYATALLAGVVGCYITNFLLRLSYSSSEVRLLHLRLIRDLLKKNGKLVIENPEKYVKEKEL